MYISCIQLIRFTFMILSYKTVFIFYSGIGAYIPTIILFNVINLVFFSFSLESKCPVITFVLNVVMFGIRVYSMINVLLSQMYAVFIIKNRSNYIKNIIKGVKLHSYSCFPVEVFQKFTQNCLQICL